MVADLSGSFAQVAYQLWKKNTPFHYDAFQDAFLLYPALSLAWFPKRMVRAALDFAALGARGGRWLHPRGGAGAVCRLACRSLLPDETSMMRYLNRTF